MMRQWFGGGVLAALSLALSIAACSSKAGNNVSCGPGTTLQGSTCQVVPLADASLADASLPDGGASDAPAFVPFAGATTVAPASTTALQITWNAWSDATTPADQVFYRVYVATSAGQENFSTPQQTTPPGATSVVLDDLQAQTAYYVIVRAVDSAGVEDTNATEQTATTQPDATAPTFGGATSMTTAPVSSIVLSWSPASDNLTPPGGITYYVYLSTTSQGEDFSAPSYVSDVGATSLTINQLAHAGTTYYAVVRARDAAGNIDANTVEVSGVSGTDAIPPVFAGCTSAVSNSADAVTVSWDPGADPTTPPTDLTYDVFASPTPGMEDFTNPAGSFVGTTVGVVAGLNPGTTYYFVCRARDISGNEDSNTSERFAATLVDDSIPSFAGITGISNAAAGTVELTWSAPATDQDTPASTIVYLAYEATTAGGESFAAAPAAISAPGASSVEVAGLAPETTYYFVVRARNLGKNTDSNTVELSTTTTVSFQQNIIPIFANNCAISGCHVPGNPPPPCGGMILAPSFAYANTVNVPACETQQADGGDMYMRITPGNPSLSLLYLKISATPSNLPPGGGQPMPFPTSNEYPLPASDIQIIHDWIAEGAQNN